MEPARSAVDGDGNALALFQRWTVVTSRLRLSGDLFPGIHRRLRGLGKGRGEGTGSPMARS